MNLQAVETINSSYGSLVSRVGGFPGALIGLCLLGILLLLGLFDGLNSVDDFFKLLIEAVAIGWFLSVLVKGFQSRRETLASAESLSVRREIVHGGNDEIGIRARDLDSFENILAAVHIGYSCEDCVALSRLLTREMMGYAKEELDRNRKNGLLNRTSSVRLLQGDVAEAWREGMTDYATVALRFQLSDVMVERKTGRVILGDESKPLKTAEVWTFRRDVNNPWKLSAIQHVHGGAA